MCEKYKSEQITNELPNPLVNFLWYLWEIYCSPEDKENHFILQSYKNKQKITIVSIGKIIVQDFGICIDAKILIYEKDNFYYMTYDN